MSPNSPLVLLFFLYIALQTLALHAIGGSEGTEKGFGRRILLSFKETPRGGNATYECDPSGPCVPCLYSEKNDEKYRCSETGYRIPLKCVEIKDNLKVANRKSPQKNRSTMETSDNTAKLHAVSHDEGEFTTSIKHRSLLDDAPTLENGPQAYITYRSCIQAVNEEKLSVLGFEGIVLCLLIISGSVVYYRRKRSTATTGFVRIQTNSRF